MAERNEKVTNNIKELAAQFLGRENNRTSLITVTSCTASPDLKRATIFITVLPTSKENSALGGTRLLHSQVIFNSVSLNKENPFSSLIKIK